MTTYFTADTHFGHDNILKITWRDFASMEEHNEVLLNGINSTVGPNDVLYILGDFAWHSEKDWVSKIKCRTKHLIQGNHDKAQVGRMMTSVDEVREIKLTLPDKWKFGDQKQVKCFLSHYPHAHWPASHRGSLHLYGHVHAQKESQLDEAFPGRRAMDVGVDNAKHWLGEWRPFSEHEILDILLARPGFDIIRGDNG